MNFVRIAAFADIIVRGHVLNWLWRDRTVRRKIRSDILAKTLPNYFKRYLSAAAAVKRTPVIKNEGNEKIFTIWQQGEAAAPDLVKACWRSIRHNCSQELVILDDANLFDYIDLPQFIIDKYKSGKIKRAHFADICRVELLYRHGGYWLDATCFATSPIPKWIADQDFFVYMAGKVVGSPYSFMQNCFIRARRGSYLLAAWRAMILDYWMRENSNFDYFMHQLIFKTLVQNDPRAKVEFAKMQHVDQDPTHALWWGYHDKPFDRKTFGKITADSFFQKTAYKTYSSEKPAVGTFADAICNMYK
ncbi:MAG: capsular polysaccharide synthesis protein [Rickettsiales bacterium]|jgi:hypothetical protein|nr:capsular polysaccharide synthesis protein [Rickettsiales bacterium]